MIPARYSASRFPGKLMQDLGGKTVILRTYEAMVATNLFDDVIVVTDSKVIYDEIVNNGGKAMMSIKEHECGSDRIAEAVEFLDIDIVINVQGDEPFTDKESLLKLIEVFKDDHEKQIDLASLMGQITDWDEINNPNIVKVIVDNNHLLVLTFAFSVYGPPKPSHLLYEAPLRQLLRCRIHILQYSRHRKLRQPHSSSYLIIADALL